jgi:hypothetical protein
MRTRRRWLEALVLGASATLGVALPATVPVERRDPPLPSAAQLTRQAAEYRAEKAKTILELQAFRSETTLPIEAPDGRVGAVTLTDLNPYANGWYLLSFDGGTAAERRTYHLENPRPREGSIALVSADRQAARLAIGDRGAPCALEWAGRSPGALEAASRTGLPYAPLCEGRLYLRNPVAGRRTSLERVAEFLRDHVWGGEQVVAFVKDEFYRDAFLEEPVPHRAPAQPAPDAHAPLTAAIAATSAGLAVVPEQLGIELAAPGPDLVVGEWYPARDLDGVYLSVVTPATLDRSILPGSPVVVKPLDAVESRALVYLVAFDLARFELHFALGTDHPRVGWSERVPPAVHDASLPGPDGIGNPAPLVTNGMVSPAEVSRTVATVTGGFKREHGAFRYGRLSLENHGSHYGFIEQGVVFSKLQPGLATVRAMDDGRVELETWSAAGEARLPQIRSARQNGVPLIEFDRAQGRGVPGALVDNWGAGNWSGSAKGDLRTLRAGLCLQASEAGRFLVYGYFSDATPSAMARVFQAYRCQYALHLDMNALEHTYLALYVSRGRQRLVQHLIQGMDVLDQGTGKSYAPRFIGFPDNRDFFFLTRRDAAP